MATVEVAALRHLLHVQPPTDIAASAAVLALAGVFLVPFEEWLFRGVVLQKLVRHVGMVIALILSSALFALAHGWKPIGCMTRFLAGLVLGVFFLRTKSLWPPIVMHYVHNVMFSIVAIALN